MLEMVGKVKFKPQFVMAFRIVARAKAKNIEPQHVIYNVNGNKYLVLEDDKEKVVIGVDYNYIFNKESGAFVRWGKSLEDDPKYSPIGPEIADVEICVDGCSGGCPFCYKGNTKGAPTNMNLETWKTLLGKFTKNLTQVAFGITDLDSNPDFLEILKYTRSQGVVPNFTMHGLHLTEEKAKEYAKVCGAIAVSCYTWNKDVCYNAIKMLTDAGMKQVNIHCVVGNDLMEHAMSVVDDAINDPRLKNLKAIVFLGLKPKGRAKNQKFTPVPMDFYHKLVRKCIDAGIGFGFDSCSAPKFEIAMRSMSGITEEQRKQMIASSESCEAYLFSSYVNALGVSWACSFTEDEEGFDKINVLECQDFLKDFWYSDCAINFRNKCVSSENGNGCRNCVVFPMINP